MGIILKTTFDNTFDILNRKFSEIEIRETYKKDKCFIWDIKDSSKAYNSLLLSKNSKSEIICEVSFYKSSSGGKYIPRLTFKKITKGGKQQQTKNDIRIALNESTNADAFWNMIGFLSTYKDLVDMGTFQKTYKVISKDMFINNISNQENHVKIKTLHEIVQKWNIDETELLNVLQQNRKEGLNIFLSLIKSEVNTNLGTNAFEKYRATHNIESDGEEVIWHHFLLNHKWIIGLGSDLRFFSNILDEQKIGIEDSKGKGSPKTDMLLYSDYTVVVELKHSNTKIFKSKKSKSRANTWDFTTDFIEAISQSLGQKNSLQENYRMKDFISADGDIIDKTTVKTVDPKTILIIGNKKKEFPLTLNKTNNIKSETFERFRRNLRNVDIITFDELFEKAYFIVFSKTVPSNWYEDSKFAIRKS